MRFFKNSLLLFFSLIFSIIIIEIFLGLNEIKLPDSQKNSTNYFYQNYTEDELNQNLQFRDVDHGGKCISIDFSKKMKWNPRFGWNDKSIDLDCVNKLFSQEKINIIFMGGSVMANYETPNYLTSIEHFTFLDDDRFRSINLAESGARLSNELSIFLEVVPKLKKKPNMILFFDGYNEFNSIRYGGKPEDDFYWTATVNDRIHNPINSYISILTERSHFFSFIYNLLLKKKSSRQQDKIINEKNIISAANDYTERKKVLKLICEIYEIDCIFIIQPIFVLTKNLTSITDIQIQKWHEKYFNNDFQIYKMGYEEILKSNKDIKNLTGIFDNKSGIYIDYVHTNKIGSKIIGENLRKIILNNLNIN